MIIIFGYPILWIVSISTLLCLVKINYGYLPLDYKIRYVKGSSLYILDLTFTYLHVSLPFIFLLSIVYFGYLFYKYWKLTLKYFLPFIFIYLAIYNIFKFIIEFPWILN